MRKTHFYFILIAVPMIALIVLRPPCFKQTSDVSKHNEVVLSKERSETDNNIIFGFPSTDCQLLFRESYDLCYNEESKVADWTSYHLTDQFLSTRFSRANDFRPDPDIPQNKRSELIDYKRSGFDRGHLVPAADMGRSPQAMSESFLLTNMAPQVGPGFNRGIWKYLEAKVRSWAFEGKDMYVYTGPLFVDESGNKLAPSSVETIGPNKVWVPTHFYKIILSVGSNSSVLDAIAFIFPNKASASTRFDNFISSIDEIEQMSGLDFIPDLEDSMEFRLEARKPASIWR